MNKRKDACWNIYGSTHWPCFCTYDRPCVSSFSYIPSFPLNGHSFSLHFASPSPLLFPLPSSSLFHHLPLPITLPSLPHLFSQPTRRVCLRPDISKAPNYRQDACHHHRRTCAQLDADPTHEEPAYLVGCHHRYELGTGPRSACQRSVMLHQHAESSTQQLPSSASFIPLPLPSPRSPLAPPPLPLQTLQAGSPC